MSRSPDLSAAIDIPQWLRTDRHTPYAERRARDRAIGRQLHATRPAARVLDWWARLDRPGAFGTAAGEAAGEASGAGAHLERLARVTEVLLAVAGTVLGAGTAGLAFAYEGDHPVNLFALLGVLVVLPGAWLLLTLCLLPGRVPGLSALQELLRGLSPAYWLAGWLDRRFGTELFARIRSGGAAGAFARWQLAAFSQYLAIGFFAGALATGVLLVAFTDLAFGWSTTLEVDARTVHAVFAALAAPWAPWLPAAVPDIGLVEASRFYRLEEGRVVAERAAALGGWWPFVLVAVATWGLAPRLVVLALSVWRRDAAIRELLLGDPEVIALLDRLAEPEVEFRGKHDTGLVTGPERVAAPLRAPGHSRSLALVWNGALAAAAAASWVAKRSGRPPGAVVELAAGQDDGELRRRLRANPAEVDRAWLFTKGWEPPLLELFDVVALARAELGAQVTFAVVPVDVTGDVVGATERDLWASACARAGIDRVFVVEATARTGGEAP